MMMMMMSEFKTLGNIQNSMVKNVLKTFSQDAAANKLINALEDDDSVKFKIVDNNQEDDNFHTTSTENGVTKVVINLDDIRNAAEDTSTGVKIDPEVYLAQNLGSIMAGVRFNQKAEADGKDPAAYSQNAEYQTGKALIADGFVRRTYGAEGEEGAENVIQHLDEGRANLSETLLKQYGEDNITTGASDAFERFEDMGFIGLTEGGAGKSLDWSNTIVNQFGIDKEAKDEDLALPEEERTSDTEETETSHGVKETYKADSDEDEVKSSDSTEDVEETTQEDDADESNTEVAKAEAKDGSFFNLNNILSLGSTALSVFNRKEHSTASTLGQAALGASSLLVKNPYLKTAMAAGSVAWNLLGGNKKEPEKSPEYPQAPQIAMNPSMPPQNYTQSWGNPTPAPTASPDASYNAYPFGDSANWQGGATASQFASTANWG
jgi:cell division septation protein DedD